MRARWRGSPLMEARSALYYLKQHLDDIFECQVCLYLHVTCTRKKRNLCVTLSSPDMRRVCSE
jgi:transcription elongation factor Elf1